MIKELFVDWKPGPLTAPFWEAAREHRLELQRCVACGRFQHPPRPFCTTCGATEVAFTPVAGEGEIYSFTVVERALLPALRSHVPYCIVLVDLDEGVRLLSLLRNMCATDVRIGLRVRVDFEQVDARVTLPVFVSS